MAALVLNKFSCVLQKVDLNNILKSNYYWKNSFFRKQK